MTIGEDWTKVKGGDGNDTVIMKGAESDYTVGSKWGKDYIENNETGNVTWLDSVENIEFAGSDATTSGETTSSYEYPITLNAALTDTDGSETLSDITLNNLPDGATISGAGVTAVTNADGDVTGYTITPDANGDATVTLSSPEEISNTDLNNIKSEVSSTESNGGDTHTTMTHTTLDESDDIGNDTYDVSNDNTVDAGDGNDTFTVDANDLATGNDTSFMGTGFFSNGGSLDLDGGAGLDTLAIDGDANIDLSALDDNLSNIEQINLGDGEQNITSLHVDDVLNVTDTDAILRIDGDSSDSINLNTQGDDAEWKLGDFKTDAETGSTYQEYVAVDPDSTVTIEVDTDIQVDES